MAKKAKAHHYISKFYLRLFVDPAHAPNLWIYERGQAEPKRLPPESIAVRSHYYAVPTPEGGKDQVVEEMLAQLESAAAPVIRNLVNDPARSLSADERGTLSAFTALMFTRVPFFRGRVEEFYAEAGGKMLRMTAGDPANFERFIRRYERDTGKRVGRPLSEIREFILDRERYEIQTAPLVSLKSMLDVTPRVVSYIERMNWAVVTPREGYAFVTSDAPVVLFNPRLRHSPYPPGFAQISVEVTFPLSPRACLLATWNGPTGHFAVARRAAREINRRTILWARKYVFSRGPTSEVGRLWATRPAKEAAGRERRGRPRKERGKRFSRT